MAPKGAKASKQAERRAAKKEPTQEPEQADKANLDSTSLLGLFKSLVLGSAFAEAAPQLQGLVIGAVDDLKAGKKPMGAQAPQPEAQTNGEKEEANGDAEGEKEETSGAEAAPKKETTSPPQLFASLVDRLAPHNCLGLAAPRSGEEATKAWLAMKNLEVDGGPRAKRKGNPGLDRVALNLTNQMAQYMHVLLAMMALRAFLFRSWFACLPWLMAYQFLSVFLPLDKLEMLPQVQFDKVDIRFRVAITIGLNALIWLFFAYEALWRVYMVEKPLYVGIICLHAYLVRPRE